MLSKRNQCLLNVIQRMTSAREVFQACYSYAYGGWKNFKQTITILCNTYTLKSPLSKRNQWSLEEMRKLKHCESTIVRCDTLNKVWIWPQPQSLCFFAVMILKCGAIWCISCGISVWFCYIFFFFAHWIFFWFKNYNLKNYLLNKMIHPSLRFLFPIAWCHDKRGKFKSYLMCHTLSQ